MAWYRKKNYLELFQLLDLIFYILEIYEDEDIPERNSWGSLRKARIKFKKYMTLLHLRINGLWL